MLGVQGKRYDPKLSVQSLVEEEINTLIRRVNAVVNEWELGGAGVIGGRYEGILKEKVRSTSFSGESWEGVLQAKEQRRRKGLDTGSHLACRISFYFSWSYSKVPDHERPYATMFAFYFDVILGKHLTDFVPANDITKYVTEKNVLHQFS